MGRPPVLGLPLKGHLEKEALRFSSDTEEARWAAVERRTLKVRLRRSRACIRKNLVLPFRLRAMERVFLKSSRLMQPFVAVSSCDQKKTLSMGANKVIFSLRNLPPSSVLDTPSAGQTQRPAC